MWAAVIRLASQSSRNKGDPYYCFRSLDSMTSSLSFNCFPAASRSFLTTSVPWIALEISSCHCKGILHKTIWFSTSCAIASDRSFEPCSFAVLSQPSLAADSQEWFALLLARTRGRNFLLCAIRDWPEFLACSFHKDSPIGPEYRSFWVATSWSLRYDWWLRCDQYFLICFGRINVDSFLRSSIGEMKMSKGWISRGKSRNHASSCMIKSNCREHRFWKRWDSSNRTCRSRPGGCPKAEAELKGELRAKVE